MAEDNPLGEFEGQDVLKTTIQVTNAGDGLSAALKVDPKVMHQGERVYVVLECEVSKIHFVPIKDTSALSRQHTLRAEGATMVDRDLVVEQLETQAERIRLAMEHEAGVRRMFEKGEEQLLEDHGNGDHPTQVPGCLACIEQFGEPDPAIPDNPEAI